MSNGNFDDWAIFYGPKECYDLDGDGHIGAFEASLMMAEHDEDGNNSAPPSYHSGKSKQGSWFGSAVLIGIVITVILWMIVYL